MYDKVKHYYVIGGGTIVKLAPHLALSAPAYGTFARTLVQKLRKIMFEHVQRDDNIHLVLTKMAKGSGWPQNYSPHISEIMKQAGIFNIETNEELEAFIEVLIDREDTKGIILSAAICDFEADYIMEEIDPNHPLKISDQFGYSSKRLSSKLEYLIKLMSSNKLISRIRKERKDIFLVGFKTTSNETSDIQYNEGLKLLKTARCNLVVANDIKTKNNFIITPEEAKYHETDSREYLAQNLAEMIYYRSQLTFTRSTVVDGQPIPWSSEMVPKALRIVVNHLIAGGAYKPFMGKTVGHFAAKLDETTFLTSIRKTNFNELDKNGLVLIKTDGDDSVIAYGSRPSVGGQSQRIVFHDHPGLDCIVHAHVPIKKDSKIPIVSQREYECGSHECGRNTSNHLMQIETGIWAVMLDKHGPNIVFSKEIDPQRVIDFIEQNFILSEKTQ